MQHEDRSEQNGKPCIVVETREVSGTISYAAALYHGQTLIKEYELLNNIETVDRHIPALVKESFKHAIEYPIIRDLTGELSREVLEV